MKEQKLRTTNVSISLPPALRDAARQAAFDDNRSLSSLVARLLNQHLQKEGYLEERAPAFRLRSERHHLTSLCLASARKRVFSPVVGQTGTTRSDTSCPIFRHRHPTTTTAQPSTTIAQQPATAITQQPVTAIAQQPATVSAQQPSTQSHRKL